MSAASLSRDEVLKVAQLARLKLSEEEVDRFAGQLGQVLDYVEMLGEVATEEVEPMAHAVDQTNVFRPDEIRETLTREEALANAPKTDGHYFLVPQILEGT